MSKIRPDVDEKRTELMRQQDLAEQGDAKAQNALGAAFAQGYFIKKDPQAALYWYAQATKQGYTHAKWNAGAMLVEGEGIPRANVDLGMSLIEQAADCGDSSACHFLALCLEHGANDKTRDIAMSEKWRQSASNCQHFVEFGAPFDIESHGITVTKPRIEWD
jgi:TPR repeat protein